MSEVQIRDEIIIEAPVVEIWKAIFDPTTHARWHPFVSNITGEQPAWKTGTLATGPPRARLFPFVTPRYRLVAAVLRVRDLAVEVERFQRRDVVRREQHRLVRG